MSQTVLLHRPQVKQKRARGYRFICRVQEKHNHEGHTVRAHNFVTAKKYHAERFPLHKVMWVHLPNPQIP